MAERAPVRGEFDYIRERLAPLAAGAPGALGLRDDAALVSLGPGEELVLTADALVEGLHFRPEDPPDRVARKALRVNLSDLAAKTAEPVGYLLCICWPKGVSPAAMDAFADGLAEDQARFGVPLLGGDTSTTPGPLTIAVTAIGKLPSGAMIRRDGARPGDIVLVTGAIGDGWLGLQSFMGALAGLSEVDHAMLRARYQLPEPRLEAAALMRGAASAAIDVSDGLLADAGHVAACSGLALVLEAERLPLSPPAQRWLDRASDRNAALGELASGGDDYELLICAPPEAASRLIEAGVARATGRAEAGAGVRLLAADGRPITPKRSGFTHF